MTEKLLWTKKPSDQESFAFRHLVFAVAQSEQLLRPSDEEIEKDLRTPVKGPGGGGRTAPGNAGTVTQGNSLAMKSQY